ncbi:pentapeptide repeat-containing protein [Nonomuraea sp. 10N515B]|uniref:pentapeptide repeat-containing protein n=1 Tax=Nonomuraea sp. 10N515B TaxID=3457422 RepID=UPI003FCECE27
MAAGTEILQLSGLTIDGKTWSAIVATLPTTNNNPSNQPQPIMPLTICMETRFSDKVNMQHYTWEKDVSFRKARFDDEVWLMGSTFERGIELDGALLGSLNLGNCTLKHIRARKVTATGAVSLANSKIEEECDLSEGILEALHLQGTQIGGSLNLQNIKIGDSNSGSFNLTAANISGDLNCTAGQFPRSSTLGSPYRDSEATNIQGLSDFRGATFGDNGIGECLFAHMELRGADFTDVTFNGRVSFSHVRLSGRCEMQNITHNYVDNQPTSPKLKSGTSKQFAGIELRNVIFEETVELNGWKSDGSIQLNSITTEKSIELLDVDIAQFSALLVGCQYFIARGHFGSIKLSRCQFSSGGQVRADGGELHIEQCSSSAPLTIAPLDMSKTLVAVHTLNGTDVSNFIFSHLDLANARLETAANLDKIVVQGPLAMKRPPRFRVKRAVLLGEIACRTTMLNRRRWRRLLDSDVTPVPSLPELQAAYRALRKSQEDRKDSPGSADFYYGEMEMRRLASPRLSVERGILTLYWIVSGYGLRAWRALALLGASLTITTALLIRFGLTQPTDFQESLIFSLQNTISITNTTFLTKMNHTGAWIQIFQKITGPALIALAALALRGRVKK